MSEEKKEESFSDLARRSDPAILIEVLERESVFVASIVISSLEPCHASLVLKSLKEPLRTQVAVEITKGMKVSNSVLEAVLRDVSIKVQALAQGGLKSLGGRDFMVDVLNEMDAERERQILEGISAKSSELAEQLKKCISKLIGLA